MSREKHEGVDGLELEGLKKWYTCVHHLRCSPGECCQYTNKLLTLMVILVAGDVGESVFWGEQDSFTAGGGGATLFAITKSGSPKLCWSDIPRDRDVYRM